MVSVSLVVFMLILWLLIVGSWAYRYLQCQVSLDGTDVLTIVNPFRTRTVSVREVLALELRSGLFAPLGLVVRHEDFDVVRMRVEASVCPDVRVTLGALGFGILAGAQYEGFVWVSIAVGASATILVQPYGVPAISLAGLATVTATTFAFVRARVGRRRLRSRLEAYDPDLDWAVPPPPVAG